MVDREVFERRLATLKEQPWIGLVHVLAGRSGLLEGARGAYVHVVALAGGRTSYLAMARKSLEGLGFEVVDIEDVEPMAELARSGNAAPSLLHLTRALSPDEPVAFSTFDAYEDD